jgi:antitoxin ParD1/3/4
MDLAITLPIELQQFVRNQVDAGLFATEADVIFVALQQLRDREVRLAELRRDIQVGIDEADRGQTAPLDMNEIRAELRRYVEQRSAT